MLPDDTTSEAARAGRGDPGEATGPERKFRVSESDMTTASLARGLEPEPRASRETPASGEASIGAGLTASDAAGVLEARSPKTSASAESTSPDAASSSQRASASTERGTALPGDRGPRSGASESQRLLSGGASPSDAAPPPPLPALRQRPNPAPHRPPPSAEAPSTAVVAPERPTLAERAINAVAPAPPAREPIDLSALEGVIVEPMLQALVSVEAKLERSHVELVGRSDQVEQRLTQLWDIEEQLGTLSELQESLLQVTEQQRRLETAVVSQTRTLRWLVGAVFFSLAVAAFVVAAVLR